ncbi:MAG: tRNA lysidine(34) synthetase TilS [Ginsengibacter sp.]
MDLPKRLTENIHKHNLFQKNDLLIIAVSGGVDSIVLCHLCHTLGFTFSIAHCNFKLRGEESDRDEQFVKDVANNYNVKLVVKNFDTEVYAKEHKVSIQAAARELRYTWFKELIEDDVDVHNLWDTDKQIHSKKIILTAHHADDNIETVLLNFMKGSGLDGLTGIPQKRDYLLRPLLFATKNDILQYANGHKLTYVEDSSNASEKYTRNFIRQTLIPTAEKIVPTIKQNITHSIDRFKEIDLVFNAAVEQLKKKLITTKVNEIHLPVLKLLKQPGYPTILFEIIKDYDFTSHQSVDVVQLLQSETGKQVRSSTHVIFKNRSWLIIAPCRSEHAEHILINDLNKVINFNAGSSRLTLQHLKTQPNPVTQNNLVAHLDFKKISFPLILRKWQVGDYFYPLGMIKKKKINRFLIDQKLSITEKENVYVLEMNKKILWIVGYRIDDRFKLTSSTSDVLRLSVS